MFFRDILILKLNETGERGPNISDYGVTSICRIGIYLIIAATNTFQREMIDEVENRRNTNGIINMSEINMIFWLKAIIEILVIETGESFEGHFEKEAAKNYLKNGMKEILRKIHDEIVEDIEHCKKSSSTFEVISGSSAVAATIPGIGPIAATLLSIMAAKGASTMRESLVMAKNVQRAYMYTLEDIYKR